jgi:hypothetical protein
MRNGDISNDIPKRVIVIADVFVKTEVSIRKAFKVIPVPKVERFINRQPLSHLYLYTTRMEVTLELASFDMDNDDLQILMDELDNMGTNPFRYFTSYSSVDHLVTELPYRPEVVGVLDIPERQLRYGHWGLDKI